MPWQGRVILLCNGVTWVAFEHKNDMLNLLWKRIPLAGEWRTD